MFDKKYFTSILKELESGNALLVAVSKTKPVSEIREVYDAGQRIFGENYVQEMVEKYSELPKDIQWHFIGHLQTNKVKQIAPFVSLIQSVDSVKLLKEIDKEGKKNGRVIQCLIQIHVAQEETKFGFDFNEAEALLQSEELKKLKNIHIAGLMGMATLTENPQQVRNEFHSLKLFLEKIKSQADKSAAPFSILSMGMSSDYKIALEEGSTMVRIGSAIFGERQRK